MKIIPAINCKNFDCLKEKISAAAQFGSQWAQIDIADGKFTKHKTWNNPKQLKELKIKKVNIEIHLMIENPLEEIDKWIEAGAKRIIIHLEAIFLSLRGAYSHLCHCEEPCLSAGRQSDEAISEIAALAEFTLSTFASLSINSANVLARNDKPIEIGLAINPDTPIEKLIPYLSDIKFIQLLAVTPGKSGQKFQLQILDKIKFLKKLDRKTIEVDGGINLQTAKLCQKAGADILVAGSYIWKNKNPAQAYKRLTKI